MSCDPLAHRSAADAAPGRADGGAFAGVRRRAWVAWASGTAATAAWPMMAGNDASAALRQRIATAVGSRVESLKGLQRFALPDGFPGVELWLAIGELHGDPKPWLLPLAAPGASASAPPLRLPTAARVELLARLDLQGPPRKIDPGGPAIDAAAPWPGRPAAPALLLRTRHRLDGGEQRDTLVIVALSDTPTLVWEEIASSLRPTSVGHRSFSLELVSDAATAPWLGLHLFQTAVPAANQPPGMPGPPLRLRFAYRGGAYQRAGG